MPTVQMVISLAFRMVALALLVEMTLSMGVLFMYFLIVLETTHGLTFCHVTNLTNRIQLMAKYLQQFFCCWQQNTRHCLFKKSKK